MTTEPHSSSSSGNDYSAGVMGADYADGRIKKPHLKFRLKVRAEVALGGYQKFHPKQNPQRVLSLGAAEGATLLYLNKLTGGGSTLDGIELSDELLQSAPPMPSNVNLIKGNVLDLPESLEEGSYDLCIALAVLEHLSDPLMCVREAYRMLRPGGVFVATCPHPFWDDVAGKFGLVKDEHHESAVNLERMQAFCRGAGFSKVSGDPFMWVVTGFLPYLGINLNPTLSLRIDSLIRAARPFHFSFVNQVVVAQK
ncbi:MAG: SAM-dependent methyltransferase [Deltaproteobacteria bacterium]|nr:MAG: SAM-dependent methyltransferase [Deltaproteobacteria bacterium]